VQAEETVEIDSAISHVGGRDCDARARRVVVAFAERHDHVQPVNRAALENRDQHLAARRTSGFDRSFEERWRESNAHQRHAAMLEEYAS
jgi:hypothetical protein